MWEDKKENKSGRVNVCSSIGTSNSSEEKEVYR